MVCDQPYRSNSIWDSPVGKGLYEDAERPRGLVDDDFSGGTQTLPSQYVMYVNQRFVQAKDATYMT